MKNLRQHKAWPKGVPGLEIGSVGRRDKEKWDYGMIMNGGRLIPFEEIGLPPLAYYCIRSTPEIRLWLIGLRESGFWRNFPQSMANAGSAECANQQYIRYAYEKFCL